MTHLGGILVSFIAVTYLDGTEERFLHVEYIKQPEGCTLVLGSRELFFAPWSAIRSLRWTLPAH